MTRDDLRAALDHPNVRAFLACLKLGEGTSDGERGYHRIVGGEEVEDLSWHPRKKVYIKRYRVWSTAAGAYQIIYPTWEGLVKAYGFDDFYPDTQDEAAVALIAGRQALQDVKDGYVVDAIRKCAKEWASLPGSTYGQRTERLDRVLAEYEKWGGGYSEAVA